MTTTSDQNSESTAPAPSTGFFQQISAIGEKIVEKIESIGSEVVPEVEKIGSDVLSALLPIAQTVVQNELTNLATNATNTGLLVQKATAIVSNVTGQAETAAIQASLGDVFKAVGSAISSFESSNGPIPATTAASATAVSAAPPPTPAPVAVPEVQAAATAPVVQEVPVSPEPTPEPAPTSALEPGND